MPDISMCADDECPARSRCYRHKASGTVPSEYQQAFTDFQRPPNERQCGHFWPTYVQARDVIVRNPYLRGVTIHDFPASTAPKDEAND
jgi:hypothetical protein